MHAPLMQRVWPASLIDHTRKLRWVDLFLIVTLAGVLLGVLDLGREWTGEHRPAIEIDLSLWALPRYTFFSLCRGLVAYVLSLAFTLLYGYWAAKDERAERVLVPLLDILQSIPVLGFMPGLILTLVAIFPTSNVGLELACVVMIFTGQAWNMTFSFYHSLRSAPKDLSEAATVFRFGWWQRLRCVELPFAAIGLVWNSMMSMAGGWFFLMINEAFKLGDRDYRLPGIGSYMSVAVEQGRGDAMIGAIVAMTVMIVLVDQLLWRPVVVWAQKFRVEEGGHQEAMSSWFLDWLRRSRILRYIGLLLSRRKAAAEAPADAKMASPPGSTSKGAQGMSLIVFVLLLVLMAYGAWRLIDLIRGVSLAEWGGLWTSGSWTLGRVLLATAVDTAWALPAGLAIGSSPRLSRILQPVVQVAASFPAPMLFPVVIAGLDWLGVSLGWGSVLLMLLGTQWYILFNVIAGATAIPADLSEAARSYRITGGQRFWVLDLPAVFPYLVTGWVTAAGGAWNASIVAEYVTYQSETRIAPGLGAEISAAAADANFPLLAASVLVILFALISGGLFAVLGRDFFPQVDVGLMKLHVR
ncbi:MAG: ABC transporter permease subunit, partial [Planctomycetes bacterium]|nr:ABC transporter permease subunit [Planctomycetota bacterium]